MNSKVVVRIKGGLGNQLFCYSAARRLAHVNNAELVIDDVTGFIRDYTYQRRYALEHFNITSRKATPFERLEPFEKLRRYVIQRINQRIPFMKRQYVLQEGIDYDSRLLDYKPKGTIYIDGLWQSENYFKDVDELICDDLQVKGQIDQQNSNIADLINRYKQTVALHVRWFDLPEHEGKHNVMSFYYSKAIKFIESNLNKPYYFVFSDNVQACKQKIDIPECRMTIVTSNQEVGKEYLDLWLMSQCSHFIIANSTFSWWGAWLGEKKKMGSIVISPGVINGEITAWGFSGLIPKRWIQLSQ